MKSLRRSYRADRNGRRSLQSTGWRKASFRLRVEPLEDRRLLAALFQSDACGESAPMQLDGPARSGANAVESSSEIWNSARFETAASAVSSSGQPAYAAAMSVSGPVGWNAQGPGPTQDGQVEGLGGQNNPVVGAIHTVAAHPTNPNILYVGAVGGGIWKTTNGASANPTWTPLTDFEDSLSTGALEFDPTDVTNQTLVAGIGRFSSFSGNGNRQTGLLRTTDGGANWEELGQADLTGVNISGVGARGSRILVSANGFNSDASPGVHLSIDDGVSFNNISGTAGLDAGPAFDLVGDPGDPDVFYVGVGGVGGGVFFTDNAGDSWTDVSDATILAAIGVNTNNIELAVHNDTTGGTNSVYVGIVNNGRMTNLLRSGDQGGSWTAMDVPTTLESPVAISGASNASPIVITSNNHGRRTNQQVRISGATGNTAANGDWVITVINGNQFSLNGSAGNGAYGGGGVFQTISDLQPSEKPGGQGGTHLSILADQDDPFTVYIGGDRQDTPFPNSVGADDFSGRLFRGDASLPATGAVPSVGIAGSQWTSLTHSGAGGSSAPHADSREMVFDANGNILEVDDGGIYRRTSPTSSSGSWSSLINNLQVAELHDVAWDSNSDIIIAGAQDTGTPQQSATGSTTWRDVQTADGGDVVVDTVTLAGAEQSIRYSSRQNLGGFIAEIYDKDNNQVGPTISPALTVTGGGAAFQGTFVTPLALNTIDPSRLLIQGANSLYESTDQGATITEIGVGVGVDGTVDQNTLVAGGTSAGGDNADVLYAASFNQVFVRTTSGGAVSPTAAPFPGTSVTDIVVDPTDWQTAYVADSNGVYQTTDNGASWTNITGDLAATGLRTLSYIPASGFDALVVGAVEGAFATATTLFDGANTSWLELGTDLPNTRIWDSEYSAADDVLLVGTMGRGAWTLFDAADAVTGEVSGTVWADLNGDGIQDGGEYGIAGVTVRLVDPVDGVTGNGDDVLIDTDTTDGSGDYLFDTLTPGDYYVEFVEPTEHALSPREEGVDESLDSDPDRLTGRTDIFTVLAGGVDYTVDAGLIVPDRFEQNDSFGAAADLGVLPGVHINQLTISESGDDDWYRLELLRPDDVDIEINFTHAFGDLNLEVTDDTGTVLPGGSSAGSSDTESVSLTGLAAGTYFVHVFGVGGAVNVYDIAMDPGATSTTRMIYVNDGSLTNDFYTLAAGDDLNDGLTHLTPKRTVQNVLDTYDLGLDDLVVVDTGTYTGTVDILTGDEAAAYAGAPHSGGGTGSVYTNGGTRWELIDADFNIVFKMTFGGAANGTGIYVHSGGGDPSTDNLLRDNMFPGTSHAMRIDGGAANVVRDNVVSGGGSYGVYMPSGGEALIEGNTISGRTYGIRGSGAGIDLEILDNDLTGLNNGVWLDNSSGTAEIRDNTISTIVGRGIYSSVATATIQGNDVSLADIGIEIDDLAPLTLDNDVHDNNVGIRGPNVIGPADWASGLENEVYDNVIGIDAENGATVRFNHIHGNATGVLSRDNNLLAHNVLYRNTGEALLLNDGDNVQITNNTIYTPSGDGVRLENFSSNVTLRNNIIWTESGYDINVATDSQVGFDSDYNNLFTSGSGKVVWWQKEFADLFDWQVEADYDVHSIGYTALNPTLDDPQFVNLVGDDYHLTDVVSTSVDAGDPASGLANEPAPAGGRINLGAYGNTTEAALSPTSYLAIDYPNYYTDWMLETPGVILWHSFGLTGDVDIDLYQQGVGKIDDLGTVPVTDESFTWTPISSGLAGSTTDRYFIRLTSVPSPVQEDSREVFSVPPVTTSYYIDDAFNTDDQYTPGVIGDNRNTGASAADPKANLLPLLRNYDLGPGDTIHVDTGDYNHVRNVILSGGVGLGDDEGAIYTGPTDPAKVARIDRANPHAGSTNIDINDGDFVTVRNLTLVGGERGLWVRNGSTNFAGEDLILEDNSQDGIVLEADAAASSVDNLLAFDNGRDGIVVLTPINTVSDSYSYSNGRYGIYATGVGTLISDNEVHDNGSYGIYALGNNSQPVITIENNKVYDNLGYGIVANTNVLAQLNTVYGQSASNAGGILLQNGATANQNVVHGNFDGVVGYYQSSVNVTNNRVYNNSRYGIVVYNGSQVLGNASYSNNIGVQALVWSTFTGAVDGNLVYDNTGHGIVINRAGAGATVHNNTVFQEIGAALQVQDSSASLQARNNILWATSPTGQAIYVADNSQTGFNSDYNLFYLVDPVSGTPTGQTGFWQGASRVALNDWQNASFQDSNALSTDPSFVDPDGADGVLGYIDPVNDGRDDDFHLMSAEGRFTGALVPVVDSGTGLPVFLPSVELTDGAQSAAIDRGDASFDFSNEPAPDGGFINLGAYGNTSQASKSPAEYVLVTKPDGGEVWPAEQTFPVRWRTNPVSVPGTAASYAVAVSADSPVAYWRLGEASGLTAADETTNHDGTYVNGVTLGEPGVFAANTAAGFDGANDVVTVPDDPALRPTHLTVEAWVKPEAGIGSWDTVMMKSSSGSWNDGFGLFYDNTGKLRFFVNQYNANYVTSEIPLDVYSHVVATYDESAIRLYVDGALVDSFAYSVPINHATTDLRIGQGQGSTSYTWVGDLDEVALYDVALGAEQVSTHFNQGPDGRGEVDIELWDVSLGSVVETIAAGSANDGEFLWTIPASVPADTDYRVIVTHTTTTETDDSNANFEITPPINVYYVNDATFDPGDWTTAAGSAANDGLSVATPKDSIRSVLEQYELGPGDVIRVDAGSYAVTSNILITSDDPGVTVEGYHDAVFSGRMAVLDRGNTAQDVFQISTDGVTLTDLHITGGRDGVSAVGANSFTLQNSTVYGNDRYGVYLDSASDDGMILDNTFDGTTRTQDYGIYVQGANVTVTGNTAFDHYQIGVYVTGDDATINGANEVYGNRSYGMSIQNSSGAIVDGNISHDNDSYGIYVSASTNEDQNVISGNEVYANLNSGLVAGGNALVSGNTAYGQTGTNLAGILVSTGAVADNNLVYGNYDGIAGSYSSNVTVTNNTVFHNTRYGIVVYNNSDVLGNTSYSNSIGVQALPWNPFTGDLENNLVYANTSHGIVVNRAGAGGRVANNTVYQDVGDALRVQDSSASLSVLNNILWATSATGHAIHVEADSQTGFSSNYNVFYFTDPVSLLETGQLGYWEGVDFTSRVDWFYELGFDGASIVDNPDFVDYDGADGILGYDTGTSTDHGGDDDFHLLVGSAAIDRGDPLSYYLAEPIESGGRVNAGAYGNTSDATASPAELVQVLSPNGFEKFEVGQQVDVEWRSWGLDTELVVGLMNAGGPTVDNWLVDKYRDNTLDGSFTSTVALGGVTDPAPEAVYQDYSYAAGGVGNTLRYLLPVPDGAYDLRLHFAEPSVTTVGSRVFDVYVDGSLELDDYDIVASAGGRFVADAQSFSVVVTGGVGLEIELVNETSNSALLSGAELSRANPGGVTDPTVDLSLSTNSGGSFAPIAAGQTMDRFGRGTYGWTATPETGSNTALIRAAANDGSAPQDDSDEAFLIANAGADYYVDDDSNVGDVETPAAIGDNANSGKDSTAPMASLTALLATYDLEPGATIHVDTGEYEVIKTIVVGADDAGVTIEGPLSGAAQLDRGNTAQDVILILADDVALDRLEITGGRDGVSGLGAASLTVQNSSIYGNDRYGVYLNSGSDGGMILGNTIDGTARTQDIGVYAQGTSVTITGNTLFNHRQYGVYITGDGATVNGLNEMYGNGSYGLIVSNSSGATIDGNLSHNNDSYGINVSGSGSEAQTVVSGNEVYANLNSGLVAGGNVLATGNTVYGHTSTNLAGIVLSSNAIADANLVHGNYDGIVGGYSSNVTVTNNTAYNNTRYGIVVYNNSDVLGNASYSNSIGIQALPWNPYSGDMEHNLVYDNSNHGIVVNRGGAGGRVANNTVYQEIGDALRVQDSSASLVVRNNILWTTSGYVINVADDSQAGFDSDYNLLYATGAAKLGLWNGVEFTDRAEWFYETRSDQNSLVGAPDFVDPSGPDGVLGYDSGAGANHGADDNFRLMTSSPAIDLGDPSDPFANEPSPNGGRTNSGVYGNTIDAAASPAQLIQVLSPNGLEKFETGQTVDIRWLFDGVPVVSSADGAYESTVLADNPLAYYRLGEASGLTANDVSGAPTLDGVYSGGPTLAAEGVFGAGLDTAVAFDGADDYVEVADPGDLDLQRQVSFSFWMNTDTFNNTWNPLIYKGNGSSNTRSYSLWLNNGGYLYLSTADSLGNQTVQTASGVIQTGQWYHVAGVIDRDAGEMRIYIDGDEKAATTSLRTNDMVSHNAPLLIGSTSESSSSYSTFDGKLDEVAIFDTALTAAQIANQHANPAYTNVDIDLIDEATSLPVLNIATNLIASGGYEWTIPGGVATDAEYRIRVQANNGSMPVDDSNEPFVITHDGTDYYINDATVLAGDWTTAPGDNANSGKSLAMPMASLPALLAAYDLDPGDTIHVDTGDYQLLNTAEVTAEDAGVVIEGFHDASYPLREANLDRGNIFRDVFLVQADQVTLSNLVIHGGHDGVWANNVDDFTVEDSHISGNDRYGVYLDTGSGNAVILGNIIDGSTRTQDYGVYALGSNATITGNTIFDHYQYGVYVAGDGATINGDNEVYGNRSYGISAQNSSGATIDGNRIHDNDSYGMYVTGSSGEAQTVVSGNEVYANLNHGILAGGNVLTTGNTVYGHTGTNLIGISLSSNAIADGNFVHSNYDGIVGGYSSNVTVTNNRVFNNTRYGILVYNSSDVIGNQTYSNSIGVQTLPWNPFTGDIENNLVYSNTNQGIVVNRGGAGGRVVNNTIFQEVGDALRLQDSSQSLLIRNNILWIESGFAFYVNPNSQTGFDSDYNLFQIGVDPNAHVGFWNNSIQDELGSVGTPGTWRDSTGEDLNSLATAAVLVDPNGADDILGYSTAGEGYDGGADDNFLLAAASPAIDRADSFAAPLTDKDGAPRVDDPGATNDGSNDYAESNLGSNAFGTVGVAQNWRSDNSNWSLALPFTFNFYGVEYNSVWVTSNGLLQFGSATSATDSANTTAKLLDQVRIAPLWDDLRTNGVGDDIFVDTTVANEITIRWDATNKADDSDVNFSVTLYDTGVIRFDYGSGNTNLSPTVGISAGDGAHFEIATLNSLPTLTDADTLEFILAPGIADIGAYEFQGSSLDVTPPTVTNIVPAEIDSSGSTTFAGAEIQVVFSEAVNPIDATALGNYDLRTPGPNLAYDDVDDFVYTLTPVYTTGSTVVTLQISGSATTGEHRLTLRGDDSIHDLAGLRLDGDNDSSEGGNYVRVFTVTPVLGDLNGDLVVDTDDVNPFVQSLTNRAAYDAQGYGVDADIAGDVNLSGNFDLGDLGAFKALVAGPSSSQQPAASQQPATASGEPGYAFASRFEGASDNTSDAGIQLGVDFAIATEAFRRPASVAAASRLGSKRDRIEYRESMNRDAIHEHVFATGESQDMAPQTSWQLRESSWRSGALTVEELPAQTQPQTEPGWRDEFSEKTWDAALRDLFDRT